MNYTYKLSDVRKLSNESTNAKLKFNRSLGAYQIVSSFSSSEPIYPAKTLSGKNYLSHFECLELIKCLKNYESI